MGWGRSLVVGIASSCVVLGATGCSDGGGGPDVGRFDAEGDLPGGALIVGDAGLVGRGDDRLGEGPVVVSHDGGRTWRSVELPGAPRELGLSLSHTKVADDLMAVVGRDLGSTSSILPVVEAEIIVWTSADGDRWDAHVLDTSGPVVDVPSVVAVGPVLVATTSTSAGFDVFASADRGSSWDRADVTGLDLAPGMELDLDEAEAADGGLRMVVHSMAGAYESRHWVLTSHDDGASWSAMLCAIDCTEVTSPGVPVTQSDRVSTDGGATWHEITVDPPPADEDGPFFSTPVEVPGGWLASASTSDPGDVDNGLLLRSGDGRSWRQMLPSDRCGGNTSISEVSDPFRFDGRWYVTYGCSEDGSPTSAVVYDGGTDARAFEPVEGTERDGVTFGGPIRDGDRLLLPEVGEDGLVGFTTLG